MSPQETQPARKRPGPARPARPEKRAYQHDRRDRSILVYFDTLADKVAAQKLAEDEGYPRNLSRFILDKYHEALSGQVFDPAMVERLRKENAELRIGIVAATLCNRD